MTTVEAGECSSLPATSVVSLAGGMEAGPSIERNGGKHTCPYLGCHKNYVKASKLVQHIRSHTGERPFVCDHDGCGASYMRNEHLKAHQRRHQDPSHKPFTCQAEGCELRFWTASQLKNHVQACHTDHLSSATGTSSHDYPCTEPGCDQTLHKRKELRQHIREHHADTQTFSHEGLNLNGSTEAQPPPNAAQLPFTCQYRDCGKSFPTNSKRKAHYRTHQEGRYTCAMDHAHLQKDDFDPTEPIIYSFETWTALQKHMKEAHPPVCPWPGCGKHFSRQDNLRAHYRRHENRKLRLELEAKVLEHSQENELNHLRADLSDNSYASSSEDEDEAYANGAGADSIPVGSLRSSSTPQNEENGQACQPCNGATAAPTNTTGKSATSSTSSPRESPLLSEEQLIHKATHLRATRPRRGGIFRDLSSPALSVATSLSERTASARPGSIATSLTSARGQASAFPCTWNGCSKVFTRKSSLSIHMRTTHLGERPFGCPGCGRRFAHKHLVSRHRRICTGILSSPEQDVVAGSRLRFSTSDGLAVGAKGADTTNSTSAWTNSGAGYESASATASGPDSDDDAQRDVITSTPKITGPSASTLKPRLLDLLTGRGYSTPESNSRFSATDAFDGRPAAVDVERGYPTAKRRRTTRNRVFACPWTKISRELDQQMLGAALPPTSHGHIEQIETVSGERTGGIQHCDHRFGRLYDLGRHLRSQHGLDLTSEELSAITRSTSWTNVD